MLINIEIPNRQSIHFNFNASQTLGELRREIYNRFSGLDENYTLDLDSGPFIFMDDAVNRALHVHLSRHAPDLEQSANLNLKLSTNLRRGAHNRSGIYLLTVTQRQAYMESNQANGLLMCPISLQLIHYPIKLNGRFYELKTLAQYFATSYDPSVYYQKKCPMNLELPEALNNTIQRKLYRWPGQQPNAMDYERFFQEYENTDSNINEYDELILEELIRQISPSNQRAQQLIKPGTIQAHQILSRGLLAMTCGIGFFLAGGVGAAGALAITASTFISTLIIERLRLKSGNNMLLGAIFKSDMTIEQDEVKMTKNSSLDTCYYDLGKQSEIGWRGYFNSYIHPLTYAPSSKAGQSFEIGRETQRLNSLRP